MGLGVLPPHSCGAAARLASGRDAFAWLIDPCSPEEFAGEYYERRLCRIARSDRSYYGGLVTWSDLDAVLGCHGAPHPDIRLARGEEFIPKDRYTHRSGRIDARRVSRHFDDGATIIFNQLQRRIPVLAQLCALVGRIFGSRVQTNIYLTPPDAQGFEAHWDTHDVFVLQVSGRKQWTIYDAKVALPLKGQAFDSKRDAPGAATDQFDLEAGSAVYIPRGVFHSARSSDDTSLHVTLGLTAFTWTDFLLESVAAAALGEESLRRSLPLGFADDGVSTETMDRLVREKLEALVSCLPAADVWRHFRNELSTANAPLFNDVLSSRLAGQVTLSSTVVRRLGLRVEFEERGAGCALGLCGQEIEFPGWMEPAVRFVVETGRFEVAALPECLDGDGKVAFVARLMREGLLQMERSGDGAGE